MFLFHYTQAGGSRLKKQLPINVLRGDPIKYFSINYNQRKNFYNFFQESIVDDFLEAVYALPLMMNIKFRGTLK